MTASRTKVGLVGYGVIGRRVADAALLQPDMELTGVAVKLAVSEEHMSRD